jgi:hypothetical protein
VLWTASRLAALTKLAGSPAQTGSVTSGAETDSKPGSPADGLGNIYVLGATSAHCHRQEVPWAYSKVPHAFLQAVVVNSYGVVRRAFHAHNTVRLSLCPKEPADLSHPEFIHPWGKKMRDWAS